MNATNRDEERRRDVRRGKRPRSITITGWLFVIVGCAAFLGGSGRFARDVFASQAAAASAHALSDLAWVLGSGLVAMAGGIFVLLGRTLGRWLCAVWLAFHVVLGLGHDVMQFVVHAAFFIGFSYLLFRASASAYFRTARAGPG